MSDLIYRQAAIDTILGLWDWETVDGITTTAVLKQTITDLKNIPRVEAEPVRHGKWVNKNNGKWNTLPVFMCSECGDYDPRLYGNENYCPNCGAKMEVDDGKE